MDNELQSSQQVSPTLPPEPPKTDTHTLHSNKKLLFVFGGVLILLLVASGSYLLGLQQNRKQTKVAQQPVPTILPTPSTIDTDVWMSSQENAIYAENGFSFRYPPFIHLIQGVSNEDLWEGNLWKGAVNDPKSQIVKKLLLKRSTIPFPEITEGGSIDFITSDYPYEPETLRIHALTTSQVALGAKTATMYDISPYEKIVRFESNNNYYELIAVGTGKDYLPVLNKILASFTFYDTNDAEWITYKNDAGKYSIRFPSDSTLYEKTYLSVDGVKGFRENITTVYPSYPSTFDTIFTVTYENVGPTSLETFVNEYQGGLSARNDEDRAITIDNKPAIFKKEIGGFGIPTAFVKHNDVIYTIGGTSPDDPILSTFKFLD